MIISLKKKWLELGLVTLLAVMTNIAFWDGELDLNMARVFFNPEEPEEGHWPLQKFWLWQGLYKIGNVSAMVTGLLALLCIIRSWINKTNFRIRLQAFYFILVILLGPGLIVNMVLKDHWGRPRPRDIVEFNGQYLYQPPLVVSNSAKHSFVCGHCSASYSLFAFYFILSKGRALVLLLTIGYGLLMGIARMTAGGHFASDVLWSGYVVFLLCWILYYYVFKEFQKGVLFEPKPLLP